MQCPRKKMARLCERLVGYDRFVGEHASAAAHRTLSGVTPICQLLPALDETAVEAARGEKGSMRLRSSQDATPTFTPLRRPARTASNRNSSKLPKRSTLFVCFNNSSSCKKPSFAVLSIMHLLFQTHRSRLSACFPSTIVQRERNRLRGASPTRQPCSTPCTKNRSGENACWAGGALTKTLLKASGSRSPRG